MPKIRKLFDESKELAGWVVMVIAAGGLYLEKLDQWPAVALVCIALVTMVGAKTYRGIHIGPDGIGVDSGGDKEDE